MAFSFVPKLSLMSLHLVLVLAMSTACLGSSTKLKETQLTMYMHDVVAGPNATNVPIAGIAGKLWSFDQFATLFSFDDLLTAGPLPYSPTVGRFQGMTLTADVNGRNAFVLSSIVFTNKEYNGSAIELQGVSKQFEQVREIAIVSGTGKFRYARGYVTLETYSVDSPNSVIRANVTVQHY